MVLVSRFTFVHLVELHLVDDSNKKNICLLPRTDTKYIQGIYEQQMVWQDRVV